MTRPHIDDAIGRYLSIAIPIYNWCENELLLAAECRHYAKRAFDLTLVKGLMFPCHWGTKVCIPRQALLGARSTDSEASIITGHLTPLRFIDKSRPGRRPPIWSCSSAFTPACMAITEPLLSETHEPVRDTDDEVVRNTCDEDALLNVCGVCLSDTTLPREAWSTRRYLKLGISTRHAM